MTTRKCYKCKEDLILNKELAIMECVGGQHIEPINLNRAQWGCQCPSCGQMGYNEISQEHVFQKIEIKEKIINKKLVKYKVPIMEKINGKDHFVFTFNLNQKDIICKGCNHSYKKVSIRSK